MNWYQDLVDFHQKFGCAYQVRPGDVDKQTRALRKELIREETGELFDAMDAVDLADIADGIVDSIYVLLGTAVSYGIDIRPVWDIVHRANMAKEGGTTREDGKILKPAGWAAPDVEGEIERQRISEN